MEVTGTRYISYFSKSNWLKIWGLGDIHLGNKGCVLSRVKRDIKEIAEDDYSFWIGTGDYIDAIGYDDKRFDPDCVHESIKVKDLGNLGQTLYKEFGRLIEPIKHKCLGLIIGNHEKKYQLQKEQSELHIAFCREKNLINLGYSSIFDIVFVKQRKKKNGKPSIVQNSGERNTSHRFRFFVHHGAGYAQTEGGKLNRIIRFMERIESDIYMMGHVHDQVGKRISVLAANETCTDLIEKDKIGIITGSYLATYANGTCNYGEQKGYAPVPIGARWVSIQPFHRRTRAQI